MSEQSTITLTLTIEELMRLPGEAVIQLTTKAQPCQIFLFDAIKHENRFLHGKGRWPVNNHLTGMIAKQPRIGCAACDRGDFQLGHAEGCPKA